MLVRTMPRIALIHAHFSLTCLARDLRNENGPHAARLGSRLAGIPCDLHGRLLAQCISIATRPARRQRYRAGVWSHWLCIYDFCGAAWRAETSPHLARWPRPSLD